MAVHEPDGTTIGIPGEQALRKRRASSTAPSRKPSLNGAWPQQKAERIGRTLSFRPSSTLTVASIAAGKKSSAKHAAQNPTLVTVHPQTPPPAKLFGPRPPRPNHLLHVPGRLCAVLEDHR